jgi:uncharacterized protein (DUF2147 family)
MRRIYTLFALIFIFSPASVAYAESAEGYWLTENERSVIHTYECDEGLCGIIHWIIEGGMQFDEKNPVVSERSKPMCGLKILWGFEKDGKDWDDGKIYKADDGDTYSANIKIKDKNTLSLRGYIGIPLFGKSQVWSRISEDDYKECSVK